MTFWRDLFRGRDPRAPGATNADVKVAGEIAAGVPSPNAARTYTRSYGYALELFIDDLLDQDRDLSQAERLALRDFAVWLDARDAGLPPGAKPYSIANVVELTTTIDSELGAMRDVIRQTYSGLAQVVEKQTAEVAALRACVEYHRAVERDVNHSLRNLYTLLAKLASPKKRKRTA